MYNKIIILILCATLLISYFSELSYRITKIPGVIFLLGFGLLMGPGLGYASKELFAEQAPLIGIIALSTILFDAGISINIATLLEHIVKATSLALTTIFSAIMLVAFTMNFVLMPDQFTLLQGMLLGAMIGGTSTVSTYGIMEGIEKSVENVTTAKILLIMESIISDPVCIVASIILIKTIMEPERSVIEAIQDIFRHFIGTFAFSSGIGLFVGVLWAKALDRLRKIPHTYIVTIAILFPL